MDFFKSVCIRIIILLVPTYLFFQLQLFVVTLVTQADTKIQSGCIFFAAMGADIYFLENNPIIEPLFYSKSNIGTTLTQANYHNENDQGDIGNNQRQLSGKQVVGMFLVLLNKPTLHGIQKCINTSCQTL